MERRGTIRQRAAPGPAPRLARGRGERPRSAAALAPASERSDPPAAPGLEVAFERGALAAAVEAAAGAARAAAGGLGALRERLAAEQIALVSGFERLLCLEGLSGFEPLPHQVDAVRRVLRVHRGRALLCDEVGLGKTIEAGLVAREYRLRGLAGRILVLAPPALVEQWREEMAVKLGLSFATTRDPEFRRDPERFLRERPLVVASLGIARARAHAGRFLDREWDLVIVDEAHHLKGRATRAHELCSAIRKRFLLLLTATPVENDLLELYNLITLLKPGQLGTPGDFRRRFTAEGGTVARDEGRLRELLREVIVRNTRAASGVVLPRRRAETVVVEPAADERALYAGVTAFVAAETREAAAGRPALAPIVLRTLQAEAGSSPQALARTVGRLLSGRAPEGADLEAAEDEAPPAGARTEALAELSRRALAIGETRKEARLVELLREAREPAVVFTKHVATLETLARALERAGIPFAAYHGGLSPAEKDREVEAFRGGLPVLLSTESGGEGRNLQFCRVLVNYDLPWNPMQIEQRIGRLHRIGQTREVIVVSLANRASIEEHILRVLDRKLRMFELVVGEMDLVLGRLRDDREFEALVLDLFLGTESESEREAAFEALGERLLESRRGYEAVKALEEGLFGDDFGA